VDKLPRSPLLGLLLLLALQSQHSALHPPSIRPSTATLARSRALKPGLIRFFFFIPEQYFSLTNSSSIPPNHPNSSRIPPSEQAHRD